MQHCINLQTLGLIQGPAFPETLRAADGTSNAISLKRGTQTPLSANFVDVPFGTIQDLGTPLDLRFGAKIAGDEDGSYVVSNYNPSTSLFDYTKTGSGDTALYTVRPGWNTRKLNNLLGYDPQGFAEETELRAIADDAGSLDQKVFKLYDKDGSVGVWIDLNNAGGSTPAAASACARQIKISDINTGADAETVAAAIASRLSVDTEFAGTSSLSNVVNILDTEVGPRTAAVDIDSGFIISEWIKGSAPSTMVNQDYVDLEGEWYWDQDGVVSKSQTFIVRVYFDINNGREGVSPDADPAYPPPGRIVTFPMGTPLADIAVSGASTGYVINDTQYGLFDRLISAAAGGGAYTAKFALPSAGAKPGAICLLSIELAASANPTVEIYDLDSGTGTLLAQVTNPAPAAIAYWFGIFTYTGTHWRKRFGAFQ